MKEESLFFIIEIGVLLSEAPDEWLLFREPLNFVALKELEVSVRSEILIKSSELFFKMGFGMDIGVEFIGSPKCSDSLCFERSGLVS
jgi:hypothetical protein